MGFLLLDGVRALVSLQQIDEALAFLGVKSVDDLDPTYLELPPSWAAAGTVRRRGSETLEEALAPTSERHGE